MQNPQYSSMHPSKQGSESVKCRVIITDLLLEVWKYVTFFKTDIFLNLHRCDWIVWIIVWPPLVYSQIHKQIYL